MTEQILIIDFGSQYTQLIARRVRELNVYSAIQPYNQPIVLGPETKGVILSGGPASVLEDGSPRIDLEALLGQVPVLGICYGAQLIAHLGGGRVERSAHREYGRSNLLPNPNETLLKGIASGSSVWMSHGDSILELPEGFSVAARTENIPVACFEDLGRQVYGLQFHPEVTHTDAGPEVLHNFVRTICGCAGDWTPAHFVEETVAAIQAEIGEGHALCGLSGGVDSTVAATLVHQAIGNRLTCVFVDNGVLRKDEFETVLEAYKALGLRVIGVPAGPRFLEQLAGIEDPEEKRKIIGRTFIEVFDEEAKKLGDIDYLVQGTIYPDVIESVSVKGPSATIKSHHNVGGLPETMRMKVVEPLRYLFKDEVRRVGAELGIAQSFLGRHPFPGPGLAIRILGAVSAERVRMLQEADAIWVQGLREFGHYDDVWQAFAVLLPVNAVGVMGDERTYENVLALRAVTSVDGMTADWAHLPYDFLGVISNRIINNVKGINRVVYDVSSKPPATIEWE